ncbi:MAG: TetR/AcrR family transcriptional regulator C-terminal ligand-binding domain-containing protein [Candidatus Binatia bacterium]
MAVGALRIGGRSARVRAAVLGAALGILREHGFAALTFDAVAQRAGVHRTTLHRRWSSRAALVAAALVAHSAERVPIPDTGSLETDLRAFARSVRDAIASRTGRGIASALADPSVAGELADLNQRFWAARFEATRSMVERAIARGELPACADSRLAIELVGGPIWFRTFVVGTRADDHFVDRVVDAALGALSR